MSKHPTWLGQQLRLPVPDESLPILPAQLRQELVAVVAELLLSVLKAEATLNHGGNDDPQDHGGTSTARGDRLR